jgi:hypothetical protein
VLVGGDGAVWVLGRRDEVMRVAGRKASLVRRSPWDTEDTSSSAFELDGRGRLVFVSGNDALDIERVSPDGRSSRIDWPRGTRAFYPGDIHSVAAGVGGDVWFATDDSLVRLTMGGKTKLYKVPTDQLGYAPSQYASYKISGLALGPDGTMWFGWGRKWGRITRNGKILPLTGEEVALPEWFTTGAFDLLARGGDDALWASEEGGKSAILSRMRPGQTSLFDDFFHAINSCTPGWRNTAIAPLPGFGTAAVVGYPRDEDEYDPWKAPQELFYLGVGLFSPDGVTRYIWMPEAAHTTKFVKGPYRSGMTPGADGRSLWLTALQTKRLERVTIPDAPKLKRGRAVLKSVGRSASGWVWARFECTGQTGTYCKGKLTLKVRGRRVGRPVSYTIPAGPKAVHSQSARWVKLPKWARKAVKKHARVTVIAGKRTLRTR